MEPQESAAYTVRGTAALLRKDAASAIRDFDVALKYESTSIVTRVNRAVAYYTVGQYSKSHSDFMAVLREQSRHAEALAGLAMLLASTPDDSLRDGAAGLETAKNACEATNQGEFYAVCALSASYAELGDFASAITHQENAAKLARTADERRFAQYLRQLFDRREPYRSRPDMEPQRHA